jgi:hypothetical protein
LTLADAWWRVEELEELRGNVLVEGVSGSYVIALDDGTLTVSGEPAAEVPGPTAQEVLTISAVSAARVSLKSAFNRYFSVHPDAENGSVSARQEAVGTMELFEPIARDDVSSGGRANMAQRIAKLFSSCALDLLLGTE